MLKMGDEGLLEHPGGMLKAKDAVRVKLQVNDLVLYNNLQMLDEKPIGSGAVGDVYRAVHKDWGCHVAYKKLDVRFITGDSRIKDLKNEAEIHHLLRHPHIVPLLGVVFEQHNYGLVLEYLPNGSLEKFLTNIKEKTRRSFSVPWKLKLKMAYDVCGGMSYLHTLQSPIIHGDLKIQNLLIGDHLIVKISDFGLSKWKDFARSHTKFGVIHGTPSHIPPEQWLNPDLHRNEKFDVYSFGIALWEIFTEEQAYAGCRDHIRELVIGNIRPSLDKLPPDLPSVISAVSHICWQEEPINRPTFSELLPRLKNYTPSQRESDEVVREVLMIYHKQDKASEHGRKMDRVSSKLSDVIRRTDQILTHLLEKRAVTSEEFEEIRSQCTIYNLTRYLLDVLGSKPVTAYQCFLEALITTDQQHLHRLLESGLLDHLQQKGVLDKQEVAEIQAERTEYKRTDRLLHYIQRTSQEQYQIFLEALQISKQEFIVEALANPNTTESVHRIVSMSKGTSTSIPKISQGGSMEEKYRKQNEAIDPGCSTLFLSKSSAVRVIPGYDKGRVWGIAVLGSELFIARCITSVEVYNTNNMTTTPRCITSVEVYNTNNMTITPRPLKISEETLCWPRLAACSHYNCLYVSHRISSTQQVMYRVELSNSSVSRWRVFDSLFSYAFNISITNEHTVLLTTDNNQQPRVLEYTTHGKLIREITLDSSIDSPRHCIQLSDGNFVICHGGSTKNRVCMVDASGQIIKCYGGSKGSGVDQLDGPYQLSVDKYDHVFVADCNNNRVQLLNPTLTLLGKVQTPGYELNCPNALHFDQINHRLYVNRRSDVLVVELSS